MSNELTISTEAMLTEVTEHNIADIIKPLTSEIFLYDTYIAGTTHLKDPYPLEEVNVGDELILLRENNRYDEKAILVLDKRERKLGYVPERENAVFSRLMDAGKKLTARVTSINDLNYFTQIAIAIYLIDY